MRDVEFEECEANKQFRPHNLTFRHEEIVTENYRMMMGLGFLR
jgi:hypothetical protein